MNEFKSGALMPTNGVEFELRILKMLFEYAINSRVIH